MFVKLIYVEVKILKSSKSKANIAIKWKGKKI